MGNAVVLIRLAKGKNGKPGTLTCLRDDDSCTWQASSEYFARHDLIHYAVETTLGCQNAFFGLLAQGREINTFGTREGRKDILPTQALWAESLVGLLQWPSVGGGPAMQGNDLLAMLAKTCAEQGLTPPAVSREQVAQIRAQIQTLHDRWARLPDGKRLELVFTVPPSIPVVNDRSGERRR